MLRGAIRNSSSLLVPIPFCLFNNARASEGHDTTVFKLRIIGDREKSSSVLQCTHESSRWERREERSGSRAKEASDRETGTARTMSCNFPNPDQNAWGGAQNPAVWVRGTPPCPCSELLRLWEFAVWLGSRGHQGPRGATNKGRSSGLGNECREVAHLGEHKSCRARQSPGCNPPTTLGPTLPLTRNASLARVPREQQGT
jgi:hypothetical protein